MSRLPKPTPPPELTQAQRAQAEYEQLHTRLTVEVRSAASAAGLHRAERRRRLDMLLMALPVDEARELIHNLLRHGVEGPFDDTVSTLAEDAARRQLEAVGAVWRLSHVEQLAEPDAIVGLDVEALLDGVLLPGENEHQDEPDLVLGTDYRTDPAERIAEVAAIAPEYVRVVAPAEEHQVTIRQLAGGPIEVRCSCGAWGGVAPSMQVAERDAARHRRDVGADRPLPSSLVAGEPLAPLAESVPVSPAPMVDPALVTRDEPLLATIGEARAVSTIALARRWADRAILRNLDAPDVAYEVDDLASMAALVEMLGRWIPLSVHKILCAGGSVEQAAAAAGCSAPEVAAKWRAWAAGQRQLRASEFGQGLSDIGAELDAVQAIIDQAVPAEGGVAA